MVRTNAYFYCYFNLFSEWFRPDRHAWLFRCGNQLWSAIGIARTLCNLFHKSKIIWKPKKNYAYIHSTSISVVSYAAAGIGAFGMNRIGWRNRLQCGSNYGKRMPSKHVVDHIWWFVDLYILVYTKWWGEWISCDQMPEMRKNSMVRKKNRILYYPW